MGKFTPLFLLIGLGMCVTTGCVTTQDQQASNLVVTESATSDETTVAPAATEESKQVSAYDEGDPDEVICKSRTITGSRIARIKDCRTREQWKQATANAQRAMGALGSRQCYSGQCNAADGNSTGFH